MSNFTYATDMVDETKEAFEGVKNKGLMLAEDYLSFLQKVNKNYQGVLVEFHEIDGDDYGRLDENGNWKSRNVVKWSVELVGRLQEGISYKVKGYTRQQYVKLHKKDTKNLVFEGVLYEVNEFIQDNLNDITAEEFDEKYNHTLFAYDMYKEEFIENPTESQFQETIY